MASVPKWVHGGPAADFVASIHGTLKRWAEDLNLDEAASLLGETLEEEKQTDEDLTALAESSVNQKAQIAAE